MRYPRPAPGQAIAPVRCSSGTSGSATPTGSCRGAPVRISLNAEPWQPRCEPEAVPAGFVGHRDPIDRAACLGRFVPPAIQQLEQRRLIGGKFLQPLSVDPRNYAGDQPGRSAHLNDGDKGAILIQSGERSASGHSAAAWGTPSVVSSDDDALSSPLAP